MDIETLFEAHHDEIYRYLWRMSWDDALAQDLTQETFLKALRALDNLPPDSNYRAWLYKIATNAQHDYWRRQKSLVDVDLSLMASGEHIEQSYEERELLAQITAAVMQLPEKQRQAMILYRYQELPYAEIALALEISEDAARANVHQAMKKLRAWMAEVME